MPDPIRATLEAALDVYTEPDDPPYGRDAARTVTTIEEKFAGLAYIYTSQTGEEIDL